MKAFRFLLILLCFSTPLFLIAQEEDADLAGEVIVQFYEAIDQQRFFQQFKRLHHFPQLTFVKTISEDLNMYLLYHPKDAENHLELLELLNAEESVKGAGDNFRATLRTTPDDPSYAQQWGLETINAPDVWAFTTGGVNTLGDTIVIANLEASDVFHEDMQENVWRNRGEIPNDGIDNDNNGYIDDYFGVNISDGGDAHVNSQHGTSVAGILAAQGNNATGVTGVSWNSKLMVVSNTLAFDEIVESYMYVHKMRKLYNDTNGEEGAFVVVTNGSFGVDGKFPDENPIFPAWCDVFDLLGEEGILSVGSTSNDEINVDDFGDMPSTCPSDFLISVTNTDQNDELDSAFSQDTVFNNNGNFVRLISNFIDLAAPGRGSFTTKNDDEYGSFGGTSAAAPHVAGSIALLYSIPCEQFAQEVIDQPQLSARLMKDFILQGALPLSELKDKTVSGGRLDLKASMELIQSYCGGSQGPLAFLQVYPNPIGSGETLLARYRTPEPTPYDIKIYNVLGQLLGERRVEPSNFSTGFVEINTTNMMAGFYFLTIENINDIATSTFIVRD
ncbi:MAG: S8 family peptidase [Bacteroidota bacterium]